MQVVWCVFLPEVKKNNIAFRSLRQSGNICFTSPLPPFGKGKFYFEEVDLGVAGSQKKTPNNPKTQTTKKKSK